MTDNFINRAICNAWLCQIHGNKIEPVFADIQIADGIIQQILPKNFENWLKNPQYQKQGWDAWGRIVTLPLINFHEHFYSRLAKGLPQLGPLDNFENVLKNLWWKLDWALDLEMVQASTQLGAWESIRQGVTYIFDHHASPNATCGSLRIIREVLEKYGLRGVLCVETSDRNGDKLRDQSLQENRSLIQKNEKNFKGMLGLHASFTISDETLTYAAKIIKETNSAIHIHLCEDKIDRLASVEKFGLPPTQRLERARLLNERSILAHGVNLIEPDYQTIKKSGAALAYNPDSNLNNSVGLPNFLQVPLSIPILVGTDGMNADIAGSLKQLFRLYRQSGASFEQAFNWIQKIYFDQLYFIKKYFDDFPSLQVGDRADFLVWDYVPPTPLTSDNFWAHYLYGIVEYPVCCVVQNGQFLMKDFVLIINNESDMKREIARHGRRLFEKFAK